MSGKLFSRPWGVSTWQKFVIKEIWDQRASLQQRSETSEPLELEYLLI